MIPNLKIKNLVYILAICLSFIPLILINYLSYNTAVNEVEASVYRTNKTYSRLKAAYLEQYFEKLSSQANMIARSESISDNLLIISDADAFESIKKEAEAKLKRFLNAVNPEFQYEEVFLTNADGIVIYGDLNVIHQDLSYRNYIMTALEGTQNWSPLLKSDLYDTNVLVISTPIYIYEDSINPVGTVNIMITQEIINMQVLDDIENIGSSANAYLIDQDGVLWSDPITDITEHYLSLETKVSTELSTTLQRAISGRETNFVVSGRYDSLKANKVFGIGNIVHIANKNLGLIIELDASEALEGLQTYRLISIIILLGIALITLITIKFFTYSIGRPLSEIENYAALIVNNHKEAGLPNSLIERQDEIGTIAKSINIIVSHLVKREKAMEVHNKILESSYRVLTDNTNEIKRLNSELEYQASHDILTNLPNRRLFVSRLENDLKANQSGAIILLDLDNFKDINDTFGHIYGDHILIAIGERLLSLVSSYDNIEVARYGGDEFLILIRNYEAVESLIDKIEDLEESLNQLYYIDEQSFKIDYSMGIALYPLNANKTFELITCADIAMYEAKRSIYETRRFYDDTMHNNLLKKHNIKALIDETLKTSQFELYYQPQVSLSTGRVDSFEALLRIKNSDIGPAEFIPEAEESQQIIAIGRWVTEAVIKQIADWTRRGLNIPVISFNFSLKQLEDNKYIEFLTALINEYNVDPKLLEIEITESILHEHNPKSMVFLKSLYDLGISLSVDDFGSGYSSLKYLTYFELSKIKLDRQFNLHFITSKQNQTIQHIIDLFQSMSLTIVAEGIENPLICRLYKSMGCDLIQSFYFSKPVPAKLAEELINHTYVI